MVFNDHYCKKDFYNQAIELENGNGDLAIYNINGSGSVLLGVATGSGVPYTEIDEIKIFKIPSGLSS